jgi:hypothetical protein
MEVSCSTTEVGSFQRLEQALRLSPHLLVRGTHSSPIPCLSLRHGLKASCLPHLSHGLGTSEPWISGGFVFKLCPFISELKLWVFWVPIFIIRRFMSLISRNREKQDLSEIKVLNFKY